MLGALAVLAIPVAVVAAQLRSRASRCCDALYVAVAGRGRARPRSRSSLARRARLARRAASTGAAAGAGPHGRIARLGRRSTPGSPAALALGVYGVLRLGAVAARGVARYPSSGRVRDREQPPRGARCAAASTSRRRSSRRRSAASTCARSRTSSSSCCPAQTYVKGFLRTYAEYLGLDGQLYVDEFNSRFVSGEEHEPRVAPLGGAAAAPQPAARDERRPRRARRDRRPHGDRHLGVEGERQQRRGRRPRDDAGRQARRRSTPPLLDVTALRGATHVTVRSGTRDRGGRASTGRCRRATQRVAIRGSRSSGCRSTRPRTCASRCAARSCTCPALQPRVIIVTPTGWHRGVSARRDRRVGLGARPRRPQRPQRPVPRARRSFASASSRRGSPIVGDEPGRARGGAARRASRATCSSSRAASGRRTTTARSSCSRARPASALHVDEALEAGSRSSRAASPSASAGRTPTSRTGVHKQATLPDGALVGRPRRHGAGRRARRRRGASPSRCPGRRASCRRSGRGCSRPSRCAGCSSAAQPPERRVLRFYGVSRVGGRAGARRRRAATATASR